jgi:ABC-type antimicrobial peptide transport system permease subunit
VTQLVARSRRELALRTALGATGWDLAYLTVGRAAWLAIVSSICGVAAAIWTARGLSALLHGLPPHDPIALASGPVITILCIATAIAGPAWRAAGVNAAAVLRGDE